ncbi:hypothetical protein [Xylophilus sp.]|nr:hypothetical protein [Xylophilus sp.]KAF1047940.1 MAG: hypothetical protein GAK38_01651 [Xylophilus sp.]
MRTYDKLIATIRARQGTAGLRACIGVGGSAEQPPRPGCMQAAC